MTEPFSKTIQAARVTDRPQTHEVAADPAQCAALAELFGLPAIASLHGVFILTRGQSGVIAAALHLRAAVTRICVITLEAFAVRIDERVTLNFVPAGQISEAEEFLALDAETLEGPDQIPYAGETIDLGAALAEQLALSLDPYPRQPGARLTADFGDAPAHPFAALAARRPV